MLNPAQFGGVNDTDLTYNATNSRRDLREAVSPAAQFEAPGSSAFYAGGDTRPDLRTTDPNTVQFPGQMGMRGRWNEFVVGIRRQTMAPGRESEYRISKGMNPRHTYGVKGDPRHGVHPAELDRLPKETRRGWE